MVRLALMFAVVIVDYVSGHLLPPSLPPLPMKDSCFVASQEVALFRLEGEAIILTFPTFHSVLRKRNIAPPKATYLISKVNSTGAYEDEGRVYQRDRQLWLLPAHASDTGEYTCTYRNETYCVTGSIKIHVYKSSSVNLKILSKHISAIVGETLPLICPSIGNFNMTGTQIQWYKDSSPTTLQLGRDGFMQHHRGNNILIPAVKLSHSGLYTCKFRVLINNQHYKVSRTIMLHVEEPEQTFTVPDFSMTSEPGLISSYSTVHSELYIYLEHYNNMVSVNSEIISFHSNMAAVKKNFFFNFSLPCWDSKSMLLQPDFQSRSRLSIKCVFLHVLAPTLQMPVIVSPLNGTVFESSHGSGLVLLCKVLTGCQEEDSTVVTWLVNGQSVESSYLDRRAMQGERRSTRVSEGCQIELRLIVIAMTEEDVKTQLKCVTQNQGGKQEVVIQLRLEDSTFTWVTVGVVALSCFLTVVSVFLYLIFKPKRKNKMDYILARQNSTF
ncbi:hypothetical protein PAMA_002871 [Pampus argenteus]